VPVKRVFLTLIYWFSDFFTNSDIVVKNNLSVQKPGHTLQGFCEKPLTANCHKNKKNPFVVFLRPMLAPSKLIFTGSLEIVVTSLSLHKEEVINNSSDNKSAKIFYTPHMWSYITLYHHHPFPPP
jgi:hypothetical protein